jgi:hypothetical protein
MIATFLTQLGAELNSILGSLGSLIASLLS